MVVTRFVAKALVFDADNNFLRLTRSKTHPKLAGLSDLPGGMVEPGEEPGAAVIREIREETGLVIDLENVEVLYAVTMLLNKRSFPTILYKIQLSDSQPTVALSYEHDDYSWEKIEKLSEVEPHIAPTYREALNYLKVNDILSF